MKIENVSKSYNGTLLFKDVTFDVKKSSSLCLYGRSGCGKTTLLNIIASLVKPDSGMIVYEEEKPLISYLFEETRLIRWLDALENVSLVCEKKIARETLLYLDFKQDDLYKKPNGLSAGMKQRVAIARTICSESNIVLLDEPFQNLDEKISYKASLLIEEKVKRESQICIITSHEKIIGSAIEAYYSIVK